MNSGTRLRRLRIFALAVWCHAPLIEAAPTEPEKTPTEVKSAYGVFRNGIRVGTVDETFTREGDRYRIVSETVAAGALSWVLRDKLIVSSEGLITGAGLQPLRYEFRREKDPKKTIRASFDWQALMMESAHDGKVERIPLRPGTQDRLSAMYQFMFATPRASQVGTWMTNGKNVEQYLYLKQGDPRVKTEAGEFNTMHYKRAIPLDEDQAEIWVARDRNYLPVRILFTRTSGARDEQALLALSVR